MRFAAALAIALLPLIAAGCRSGRKDVVEAELRTKERMLRETREELDRARLINEAFERDFIQRQQGLPPLPGSGLIGPREIAIGRGTGGVDEDGQPGDEALLVVVVPKDEDGQAVRALGVLQVSAWEIMPGGVKVPLSTWDLNTEELRKTWKAGLLTSGFHVRLKWQKLPTQSRLRIVAQMLMPDGRTLEADKDVSIKPLPMPPVPPAIPMEPGPSLPNPAIILPPRPAAD